MIFIGGTPLGAPAIGWVGEVFGPRWTLIAGGLLSMIGVAGSALLYLRAKRRSSTAPEPVVPLPDGGVRAAA